MIAVREPSLLVAPSLYDQCAILDENGVEIPITEEMIMHACDELMKDWQFPITKKVA